MPDPILSIDESLNAQQNDTATTLPGRLNTGLVSLLGSSYSSLVKEKATVTNVLTNPALPANTTDVAFTNASGGALSAVDSDLIAISGRKIFLYTFSGDNNLVIGREGNADGTANSSGAIAFICYLETNGGTAGSPSDLNATNANLWVVEFTTLQHYLNTDPANPNFNLANDFVTLAGKLNVTVTNPINFDATGAPSGANLFITYGDGTYTPNEVAVVVTAPDAADQSSGANISSGGVVKTSQAGSNLGGATFGKDSQMFDPPANGKAGESLYFTFVKGADPSLVVSPSNELTPTEANVEDNIRFTEFFGAEKVSFVVSQLQQAKQATLKISAWNAVLNDKGTASTADDSPWTRTDYVNHQNSNVAVAVESVSITRIVQTGKNPPVTYIWTFVENQSTNAVTVTTTRNGVASTANGDQPAAFNVSANFAGATVVVRGAIAGDKIVYDTVGDHDRLQITNVGDANAAFDAAFDIGALKIESGGITTNPFSDIRFYDDGPNVSIDLKAGAEARVDESLLQNGGAETEVGSLGSVTVTAATLFTESEAFGRDGQGASTPSVYSLKISSAGVDSLLDDTATGSNVLLYMDGNDVVGRAGSSGGSIVFRIAINSSTGAVTLTQYRAMVHDDANDPDEAGNSSLSINSGVVFAVHTVKDADNDTVADDADIGPAMKFEDDGPSVTIDLKAGAEVRVDESLLQNGLPETEPAGTLGQVTVAAAVLFDETAVYGQDGAAASNPSVYSLSLSGPGADSLLDDSATGSNVLLYFDGADIVGRSGSAAGAIVFRIAINASSGAVTLTQYRAMKHDDANDPDEAGNSSLSIASGLVAAVRTVTDKDGDSDDDNADIGPAMKFEDDGPSVTIDLKAGAEVRVDESLLQNGLPETEPAGTIGQVTVAAAVLFDETAVYGQDGAAASNPTVYSLRLSGPGADSTLDDTATGSNVLLYFDGADIVGRAGSAAGAIVFRIAINSSSGAVTLTQYRAMVHDDAADPDEAGNSSLSLASGLVAAVRTITDRDGDSDDDDADIGPAMKFEDDGPSVTIDLKVGAEVRVDESLLQNGLPETEPAGTIGQVTVAAAVLFDETAVYGQDGAAASNPTVYSLSLSGPGADSTLDDTATGSNVLLYFDGADIVGRAGSAAGAIVFRIAINSSSGAVTLTQYRAMVHDDASDPDEPGNSSLSIASGLVAAVRTITDKDGDSDDDNADIGPAMKFEDDGPNAAGSAVNGAVDEDGTPLLAGANPGGPGDASDGSAVGPASIVGIFGGGSDGVKNYSLSVLTGGLPQTLKSQGGDVKYNVTGNVLTAYVEAGGNANAYDVGVDRKVFTLTLSGTGNSLYTFTMFDQLDHPGTNDPGTIGVTEIAFEDELTLNLGSVLVVTDGDNDTATAGAEKLVISVDDDSAVINGSSNLVYANSLNGAGGIGGTAKFDYSIGVDDRDTYSASSKDLLVSLTSGSVGTGPFSGITNQSVTWFSENDSQAVYNFSFTYVSNPNTNATSVAGGTITFDKVADTYKVVLTNPIQSFSVLTLRDAAADAFKGYEYDSTTSMGGIAGVNTVQLSPNFFVQFKGFAEPSGNGIDGVGINNNANLDALALGEAWSSPDDDGFTTALGATSELFTLALPAGQTNPAGVSISGTSAGTNSDTMQQGEVLDFTFYSSDPKGLINPAGVSKTTAPTIFIEFDQLSVSYSNKAGEAGVVTGGEDMVIVLKLVDPNNPNNTTTRAIIVEAQDIYHAGQTLPSGFGFTSAITGNNGLVIIRSSDYNGAGENWVIQGAQVLASTEGVTGSGVLNLAAVDANGEGASSTSFSTSADSGNVSSGTWDSDVFKIVNIGFVTNVTPDSTLNFSVQAVDFDGDTTAAQSLVVKIESDNLFTGTNSADVFVMRDIPADIDQTLTQETRTITGFDAAVDLLDFTTDATAANMESGAGPFASLAAYLTEANTQLDGTTDYYFGVVGTDGYLAYDGNGTGMTALIKMPGVTSGFNYDDII